MNIPYKFVVLVVLGYWILHHAQDIVLELSTCKRRFDLCHYWSQMICRNFRLKKNQSDGGTLPETNIAPENG